MACPIPREAPVTSAVGLSRHQSASSNFRHQAGSAAIAAAKEALASNVVDGRLTFDNA